MAFVNVAFWVYQFLSCDPTILPSGIRALNRQPLNPERDPQTLKPPKSAPPPPKKKKTLSKTLSPKP